MIVLRGIINFPQNKVLKGDLNNMKKIIMIILIIILITGCFGNKNINDQLEVEVIKNEIQNSDEFSQLLFFSSGTSLDGLDPETNEIKVQYKFNHIISFGDVTEDGRVFLCDLGSLKNENWGSNFFVIDYQGEVLKTVKTISNPAWSKIQNNKFFISNKAFHGDGYTKIAVYDIHSYKELKVFDDIKNHTDNVFINEKDIFFNIYESEYQSRHNHILEINSESLKKEELNSIFKDYPYGYSESVIYNDILVTALRYANEVSIFDYLKKEEVKRIKIRDIVDVKEEVLELMNKPENAIGNNESDFWAVDPIVVDDAFIIPFTYISSAVNYARFLYFDKNTYELIESVDINNENIDFLPSFHPKYVKGNYIYFKHHNKIEIYNYKTKQWEKQIYFGEY